MPEDRGRFVTRPVSDWAPRPALPSFLAWTIAASSVMVRPSATALSQSCSRTERVSRVADSRSDLSGGLITRPVLSFLIDSTQETRCLIGSALLGEGDRGQVNCNDRLGMLEVFGFGEYSFEVFERTVRIVSSQCNAGSCDEELRANPRRDCRMGQVLELPESVIQMDPCLFEIFGVSLDKSRFASREQRRHLSECVDGIPFYGTLSFVDVDASHV